MSDSQQEKYDRLGKNTFGGEFFSENPFKFEDRSSRSVSEHSDNDIIVEAEIIKEDVKNQEKYKVMKIDIAESSKSNSSIEADHDIVHQGSSVEQNYAVRSMEEIHESSSSQDEKFGTPKKGSSTNISTPLKIPHINKKASTKISPKKQQAQDENRISQKGRAKKRQKIFQKFRSPTRKTQPKSNILDSFRRDNENNEKTKIENKVNFEKKRENQSALKSWNYARINRIQFHREIVEEINKGVDQIMKESLVNLELYRTFFLHRIQQEERYVSQKVTNTSNAFSNNKTATNIYMNCSSMLNFLAQKENQEKNRIKEFVFLLKDNIIKGIFDNYMNSVNKQLLSLRERLSGVKQALKKVDEKVCSQLIELERNFTECCDNLSEQNNDFYIRQITFLRQCEAETNLELKLGRLCFEYFKAAIKEEKKRSLIIKESLFTYIRCAKQFYKSAGRERKTEFENEDLTLEQLSKGQEENLIEEVFSLEQMLSSKSFKDLNEYFVEKAIKKITNDQKAEVSDTQSLKSKGDDYITENQLNLFLTQLEFEQFDRRLLIVRRFQVTILKEEKWMPGEIIITIDRYIHAFVYASLDMGGVLYGNQCYPKPELSIKISQVETMLLTKEEDVMEDIEMRISCKLGTGRVLQLFREVEVTEERVRFCREEDLLQFEDYLQELSS